MKKVIFIMTAVFFLLQPNSISAQEDIATSKALSNSLSTEVENVSRRDTEKIWKNLIKKYDGKTKKGKNNSWYTENVSVPKIGGEGTVKMFMKIDEKDDVATTTFLVSKDGEYINYADNPEEAEEVESIYREFIYELKKKSFTNESENEENNLKDLNKGLEKLVKNNKKYHEEIEKCKKKIAEMEGKITQNLDEQETKKEEITAQKAQVDKVLEKLSSHKM